MSWGTTGEPEDGSEDSQAHESMDYRRFLGGPDAMPRLNLTRTGETHIPDSYFHEAKHIRANLNQVMALMKYLGVRSK